MLYETFLMQTRQLEKFCCYREQVVAGMFTRNKPDFTTWFCMIACINRRPEKGTRDQLILVLFLYLL